MVIRYWHSADGETEGAVHAVVLGEHDDIIVVVIGGGGGGGGGGLVATLAIEMAMVCGLCNWWRSS